MPKYDSFRFMDGYSIRETGSREVAYLLRCDGWNSAAVERLVELMNEAYDAGAGSPTTADS